MLSSRNRPNRSENRGSRNGRSNSRGHRYRPSHPQGSRELSHRWCPAGSTSGQASSPCQRRSPPHKSHTKLACVAVTGTVGISMSSFDGICCGDLWGASGSTAAQRMAETRSLDCSTGLIACLWVRPSASGSSCKELAEGPCNNEGKAIRPSYETGMMDSGPAASGSTAALRMAETHSLDCSTGLRFLAWVSASAPCSSCKGLSPGNEGKAIPPEIETCTSHLSPGASGSTAVQRMAETCSLDCSTGLFASLLVWASASGSSCKGPWVLCNEGKIISPEYETCTSHLSSGALGRSAVPRMADICMQHCST